MNATRGRMDRSLAHRAQERRVVRHAEADVPVRHHADVRPDRGQCLGDRRVDAAVHEPDGLEQVLADRNVRPDDLVGGLVDLEPVVLVERGRVGFPHGVAKCEAFCGGEHRDRTSDDSARGDGRAPAGVDAARRCGAVLVRGRTGPGRLRQLRAVRDARRGRRGDLSRAARDDDRDRAAPLDCAAREAGRLGARALRRPLDARARGRGPSRRLRRGRCGAQGPREAARRAVGIHPGQRRRRSRRPVARRDRDPRRRIERPRLLANGAVRRRLRPQRRAAPRVRQRCGPRPGRLERPRPPGQAEALGSGLLRVWRSRPRGRVPPRLLRVHRALRREDRRGSADERPCPQGLRARLRGGRLRRARPLSMRSGDRRTGAARGGARVNVEIVGGGPAGLYLATLLRKLDSGVDVRVLERNAPDATFGFGVVFSEETLGALRDADPETHLEITDTFARWDRIDIRYQGRELSSRGHSFSAIARKRLLEILQARCRELGAALEFGVEVEELPQADLVVAADGANSLVRRLRDFGTNVRAEGSKYVWFGTDHVFDAFTFAFRDTEHGLFNAHAYPYDERMSTFIVECPEGVWRAAGLDAMDEQESLAFCEQLFANELRGRELYSNRSLWLDFPKITNRTWHVGNVVILGDAAHTAHFSIGSGTKLAMEDSISLAAAVARRRWDLEAAFFDYELEREPYVERTQDAASESAAHFGRIASYSHLEPIQFAFNLITRAGRITHSTLSVRDPQFTRALDSWFGGRPVSPPPAFSPFELRGVRFDNRFELVEGSVAVSPEGRVSAEDMAQPEGKLLLRLTHAGRRGSTQPRNRGVDLPLAGGWPVVAPTRRPYAPFGAVPTGPDEEP